MKCYRKNGSDQDAVDASAVLALPSMKCYRKNGSDANHSGGVPMVSEALNEVLPKER